MSEKTISVWSWRQAILKSKLEPSTRFVLLVLSTYMNDHGESCFPSTETITEATGLSRRSVFYHIKKAIEAGFLLKTKHGYGDQRWARNDYEAKFPSNFDLNKSSDSANNDIKKEKGGATIAQKVVQPLHKGSANNDIKVVQPLHTNSSVNSSVNSSKGVEEEVKVSPPPQELKFKQEKVEVPFAVDRNQEPRFPFQHLPERDPGSMPDYLFKRVLVMRNDPPLVWETWRTYLTQCTAGKYSGDRRTVAGWDGLWISFFENAIKNQSKGK